MTGRMYNEKLGGLHFILAFLGFNGTYLPMFWLGLNGMPRRVATYIPEFTGVNRFVSICGFILGLSFVIFWINMIYSWLSGPKAPQKPWKALTLEMDRTVAAAARRELRARAAAGPRRSVRVRHRPAIPRLAAIPEAGREA